MWSKLLFLLQIFIFSSFFPFFSEAVEEKASIPVEQKGEVRVLNETKNKVDVQVQKNLEKKIDIAPTAKGDKKPQVGGTKNTRIDINFDTKDLLKKGNDTKVEVQVKKVDNNGIKEALNDLKEQNVKNEKSSNVGVNNVNNNDNNKDINTEEKKEVRDKKDDKKEEKKEEDKKDEKQEDKNKKFDLFGLGKSQDKKENGEQNIEITGKYDDKNDAKVLVIKDGVKNINITFKPEINVGNCDGGGKCEVKKSSKVVNAENNAKKNSKGNKANVKKKAKFKKLSKKTSKNKMMNHNKVVKNNKTQRIKEEGLNNEDINRKQQNQTSEQRTNTFYSDLKTLEKGKNTIKKPRTIRQIYEEGNELQEQEKGTLACNGNDCQEALNNGARNEKTTIIKQETPVYIINRVISVDEDMNLTEEAIDQLISENDGSEVKRINSNKNDNFKSAYLGGSEVAFVNQYNIVDADNLRYGEVAFVNDYND